MRIPNGVLLTSAAFLMLVALVFQNVTLASRGYRTVLLIAVAALGAADFLCGVVFLRGGRARWIALIIALPTLFILGEFARRAPYAWGVEQLDTDPDRR